MVGKSLPVVLLIGGVLLFLLSLAADAVGIGGAPGMGWKQISGAIVGVGAAGAGLVLLRRR